MRTAFRVLASLAAAALIATPVRASPRDEDLFIGAADLHTVVFGSLDAGRSTFASAGFKHTPVGSLDRTGPVLMETNGYGLNNERYRVGGTNLPAARVTAKAATLVGWQWTGNGLYLAALAGPELVDEQLTVAGRIARLSQVRPGLQVATELWADVLPRIVVNGSVFAGSAQGSAWARLAAGYKVTPDMIVGPEVTEYVTRTYHETRWGGHVTGIPIYLLRLRLSGGWMMADDGRPPGPYVSASVWMRM